ncbi:MAG TPA: spondin domain-containing protein [Pyrinomonadaceae bacterium]|jgi:hypothetical protein|nr:spondin domain-containing protein [Pyrinomonadaceae bacterium]
MRRSKFFDAAAFALAAALCAQAAFAATGRAKRAARTATFKVRIENVSAAEGQASKDGARWPFALSPGLYVVGAKPVALFKEGRKASAGLESQAEDGNPSGLVRALEALGHEGHGVFDTPVGAGAPAPIGPGGAYEFTLTAAEGDRLTLFTMFGQSNDYFYSNPKPIALFDSKGEPAGGDVTTAFTLFDAGTEVNEEPGVGPDQAPRQKSPNTGAAENGVVRRALKDAFYARTPQLFRVTITPVD